MSGVVVTKADAGAFAPCGWEGRDGVTAHVLWRGAHGARTALLKYPAKWRRDVPEYVDVDEALLALDGCLYINGTAFRDQAYAAFAPGAVRLASQAPDGALTLSFFAGAPSAKAGMTPQGLHDPSKDVRRSGLYFDGWDAGFEKINAPLWQAASARIKLLRREASGAETFIVGTLPLWRAAQAEKYALDLELLVIEGDLGWDGVDLGAHDHVYVPAGTPVGPFRSADGATLLIRSHGPFKAEAI
ncbi:MAG: hypothetical protein FJX59_14630 [Alphaproteobacteria bacterium]|nr:hypothetical protein [Alphaproteobacteria bacterium]